MRKPALSRLAAALAALILVLCVLPAASAAEHPFADVADGIYYHDPVVWAYREGITAGTSETTFSPDLELSYAEICTFLYRYAYSPAAHYTEERLSDYAGQFFYDPINWCCDFGVLPIEEITGERCPLTVMTRNDYVCFLYRYAARWEKRSVEVSGNRLGGYDDAPEEEPLRAAWNWAVDRGVVSGTSSYTLSPEMTVTRAQFVTMLYRYNEYRVDMRPAPQLRIDTLMGRRLRGWQRTLAETGELACGVPWKNYSYQLGPDGIPTLIDCSGIVNWVFSFSGIYPYPDLDSRPLWESDYFTRVDEKQSGESGFAFYNRVAGSLKRGDLMFCGSSNADYHVMVFLGANADYLFVYHSTSLTGTCVQALPYSSSTKYLAILYGVKRYIP